jgi:hypothetical protein
VQAHLGDGVIGKGGRLQVPIHAWGRYDAQRTATIVTRYSSFAMGSYPTSGRAALLKCIDQSSQASAPLWAVV